GREGGGAGPGHGRLPRAGLADEPERLASADLQRDPVDCVNLSGLASEDHAAAEREVLDEIAQLDQRADSFRLRARTCRMERRPVHPTLTSLDATSRPMPR